jgi:hypothetical protein
MQPQSSVGSSSGGFLTDLDALGNAVGDFLGGTGGQLIGAGLSINELNKITDIAQRSAEEQAALGRQAQQEMAFKPFTVSTGFGGVTATPEGGYATTLSPAMAAQQQALQGITSGLIGGVGGTPFAAPTTGLSSSQPSSQPPSLQGLLAGRGINMPQKPMISTADMNDYGTDPVTGERRFGGSSDAGYYRKLDEMYAQNPEALELAKQYSADPSQFIGQSVGLQPSQFRGQSLGFQQPSQPLQAPSTGGFGAGIPDVSGIQRQALGGVGGFLTGAMAPMAQREADVYERIRATQRPEEQRAQLALEERLAAQGRTGLRTAQFGGSPEQLALAQAQEEAKARASLGALQQAQAEQLQQAGLAESMFGLGGRAAALPASLQQAQLGNIGAAMGLQYMPEQQLLGTLTPALSIADLARTGQQLGAQTMSAAGISGLEDILQAETVRSQNLRDIYSTILGAQANQQAAQTAAAGQQATNTGLFSSIGDIGKAIGRLFT